MAMVSTTNFNALFKFKAFSLLAALFLNLFLVGCGGGGSSNTNNPPVAPTNAAAPTITIQPKDANYTLGDTTTALNVTANVTDGGTLSYQWYETTNPSNNGNEISGAASSTYSPSTSTVGTFYYYVVITNTNNNANGNKTANVTSDTAQIIINLPIYSINFYDENLDFLKTVNETEGTTINLPTTPTNFWYKANETSGITQLNVIKNINLYAIQKVQEITTQTQLAAINTNDITLNSTYILLNDINLTSGEAGFDATLGWEPIGNDTNNFRGLFNGNNNTITNLWINRPSGNHTGLFGSIRNTQIRNLGVETAEGKEIKGYYQVGGIVGYAQTAFIINAYFTGNVSGDHYVGGIAGETYNSTIANSYAKGDISSEAVNGDNSGNSGVGGIAGWFDGGNIINAYSSSNINGSQACVGGIVGGLYNYGNIVNSHSTGNISGVRDNVGGIAGYVNDSNITNSYSTGNISGSGRIGGIVGHVGYGAFHNNVAINPSIVGTVRMTNRVIGSYDGIDMSSDNFVLESIVGGVNNSFSNEDNVIFHGRSKTAADLTTNATYSNDVSNGGLGWKFGNDINNPWKINEGNGYPYLYWQK
jgi:hypothetical protein